MDSREKQDLIDEFGPISDSDKNGITLETDNGMADTTSASDDPIENAAMIPDMPEISEPTEVMFEIEEETTEDHDAGSENNDETAGDKIGDSVDDSVETDEKTAEVVYDFIGADPDPAADKIGLDPTEVELVDTKDKLLRLAAEFENFKKRRIRERDEQQKYSNERLVKDLLPVLDNLERALNSARQTGQGQVITSGLDLVIHEFLRVLAHEGVEPVITMGKPFDPAYQEALQSLETADSEPGTVVGEILKGYTIYGRVLRAALVVVAKEPQSAD